MPPPHDPVRRFARAAAHLASESAHLAQRDGPDAPASDETAAALDDAASAAEDLAILARLGGPVDEAAEAAARKAEDAAMALARERHREE